MAFVTVAPFSFRHEKREQFFGSRHDFRFMAAIHVLIKLFLALEMLRHERGESHPLRVRQLNRVFVHQSSSKIVKDFMRSVNASVLFTHRLLQVLEVK
jgi:hypothetical protein